HKDAFNCCSSLETVVLPDGLTALDMDAFSQCYNLQTLVLPESLTHIGAWNPDNNPLLQTTVSGDITYIGSAVNPYFAAIYVAEQCTVPTIADGAVLIAANLGSYNSNITNIIFPDSVRHIGEYAFHRCKNLTEIILPDGVLTVAQGAFDYSDDGATVRIPSSIEVLGTNFNSFDPTMNVLNGISYVGNEENPYLVAVAPVDTRPTAVSFADGVRVIAIGCFRSCHNLTELVIPEGVVTIAPEAFSNCRNLKTICLPASLRSLGDLAFYESVGIETITVAADNTAFRVENGALVETATQTLFWSDSAGYIPEGVKKIAEYAYYQHKNIADIILPDSVCEIGEYAFADSSLTSIVFPEALVGIPEAAFRGCNALSQVTFSEGLRYIKADAFYGCDLLESIDLPSTLLYLGDYAFYSCDLPQSIVIPEGVRSIPRGAFAFCSGLKNISLPTSLLSIHEEAFRATALETLELPDKVSSVGTNALPQDGTLTSVTLHSANIYFSKVFPASVTDIYFLDGTKDTWNKGTTAGYLAPLNAIVHCSDGDIAPIA
ncbi:MAG: leucine-rich repeat domain-containing protein, partial [Clostridia bacterium]|nr:leucine-rich repeat domain-containing protein [Clostridia bacterium]